MRQIVWLLVVVLIGWSLCCKANAAVRKLTGNEAKAVAGGECNQICVVAGPCPAPPNVNPIACPTMPAPPPNPGVVCNPPGFVCQVVNVSIATDYTCVDDASDSECNLANANGCYMQTISRCRTIVNAFGIMRCDCIAGPAVIVGQHIVCVAG